jgi:hypothetical protein
LTLEYICILLLGHPVLVALVFAMEESALRPYEERALAAERRIQVIEDKLAGATACILLSALPIATSPSPFLWVFVSHMSFLFLFCD